MTRRQYGPTDETQEIPYDPTRRETQEIPITRTDSQRLRAVTNAYLPYDSSEKGLNVKLQGEMIVSELESTIQELAHEALENYKRSKGETK